MALGSRQTSLRRELKSNHRPLVLADAGQERSDKTPAASLFWKHRLPTYNGRYWTRKQTSDARAGWRLEAGPSLAMNQHSQRRPSKI